MYFASKPKFPGFPGETYSMYSYELLVFRVHHGSNGTLIISFITGHRSRIVADKEAKWHTIARKDVEPGETGEEPLYLGMHFLNRASFSLEVGSREYEKARKDQNCVVLDDGSVKAIKKIPRNYEVLLMGGHSEEEHMGSVVNVRKWNVLQADSRIGRRRELICTKIASCSSSVCRNCIHL